MAHLGAALAKLGVEVAVWAPDRSAAKTPFLKENSSVKLLAGPLSRLIGTPPQFDVMHDNGIWMPHNHRLSILAQNRGIPRLVSPRGMLEPWSIRYKRWKKVFAWRFYQRLDLQSACALHATATSEKEGIEELCLNKPVCVIPNGIEFPLDADLSRRRKLASTADERTMLFLGRIHPKKGLPLLVEAWAKIRPVGWRVHIVGPDENDHRAEVERMVRSAGLAGEWHFQDAVDGLDKSAVFAQADVFVLPTHSENFGMSVGEALAHGIPVITTQGTPWSLLETEGGGWWTPISVDGIAAAIADATSRSREDLHAMGERGRDLVRERFTWEKVAADMKSVYEWMLGQGVRPACVTLD